MIHSAPEMSRRILSMYSCEKYKIMYLNIPGENAGVGNNIWEYHCENVTFQNWDINYKFLMDILKMN